jgi:hypothetical protein
MIVVSRLLADTTLYGVKDVLFRGWPNYLQNRGGGGGRQTLGWVGCVAAASRLASPVCDDLLLRGRETKTVLRKNLVV